MLCVLAFRHVTVFNGHPPPFPSCDSSLLTGIFLFLPSRPVGMVKPLVPQCSCRSTCAVPCSFLYGKRAAVDQHAVPTPAPPQICPPLSLLMLLALSLHSSKRWTPSLKRSVNLHHDLTEHSIRPFGSTLSIYLNANLLLVSVRAATTCSQLQMSENTQTGYFLSKLEMYLLKVYSLCSRIGL